MKTLSLFLVAFSMPSFLFASDDMKAGEDELAEILGNKSFNVPIPVRPKTARQSEYISVPSSFPQKPHKRRARRGPRNK